MAEHVQYKMCRVNKDEVGACVVEMMMVPLAAVPSPPKTPAQTPPIEQGDRYDAHHMG
jgi:hypothetical protein